MWFIPVVCKYVQCQSIILDLSWGLSRFKYCFSVVLSSLIILYRFCVCHLPMIYIWRCHFRCAKFPKRLAKTGVLRHKFWIWNRWPRISTARWAAIHPSSNCTTHSRDPLCDRSILSDSRGGPQMWYEWTWGKHRVFQQCYLRLHAPAMGKTSRPNKTLRQLQKFCGHLGVDTSFGTGKLYLITNCLVNHRCRTVTFQID